ncbi:conserved hypothetical protein [Cupriavidus taiwanensis]|uniref:Uncharacterized protein n=1 Tax=Cupriavidus taiwanensis TaxID=164546 RepID=A0A7Z7JFD1_9BURK|nr:conserved hypothetical protein [Cupriavidus taiwanensis]SOZ96518.1 conserved hypothetical protein [Cupriavidus taiwanensis]SPC25554.1 conserved hypothetical protein [Cupriavidus taiwanensis]
MMQPTKKNLLSLMSANDGRETQSFCSGYLPHPNPRMYKYFWRVFAMDTPWESTEFFVRAPVLTTAHFMEMYGKCRADGVSCLIYSYHLPRHGSIFDQTSAKWEGVTFAPAWDDDQDAEWRGHK